MEEASSDTDGCGHRCLRWRSGFCSTLTGGSQEQKPVVISAVMDYGVLVNGKEVAGTGYMNADAKQVMIPLRVYPRRSDLNWVGINRTDLRS